MKLYPLRKILCLGLVFGYVNSASAERLPDATAPVQAHQLSFKKIIGYADSINLSGVNNEETLNFDLRKDQIVHGSSLHLEYMPSPSLLPALSQLLVYFNDDLVGVYPINQSDLGQKVVKDIAIDPLTVNTKNTLRFKFIGHYTDICENTLHSSLWLKVLRTSAFNLNLVDLPLQNDLSFLPTPFIDRANDDSLIHIAFKQSPDAKMQQAASIVSSWFATQAKNSKVTFQTTYNTLSNDNSIVFATNSNIPSFLNQTHRVHQPTIEMMNHPTVANKKLLVFWGRDEKDLVEIAKAFATNNMQLAGTQVALNKLVETGIRQPYDAPNWLPIDQPLTLGKVKTYAEQLSTTGFKLNPLNLYLQLPPDLFALGKYSTAFDLKYRYTNPATKDDSRVLMYINNQFYKSLHLGSEKKDTNNISLQLPIHQGLYTDSQAFKMPGIMPDRINNIRFEPYFMSVTPGGSKDQCVTYQPVANAFTIDDDSVIDFTKFAHYMKMPNLHAFVYSGFPFSRLADLSETLVVTPKSPTEHEMNLILNTVGTISSKIGLPAYNVTFADANTDVSEQDKDILLFENYAHQAGKTKLSSQDFNLKGNLNELNLPLEDIANRHLVSKDLAKSQANLSNDGSISALVGYESKSHKQRSVVALLTNNAQSVDNLSQLIQAPDETNVFGSLAIVRPSGVTSVVLDNQYDVGRLSTFQRLQIFVAKHMVIFGVLALSILLLVALFLTVTMKKYRKNRVNYENKK